MTEPVDASRYIPLETGIFAVFLLMMMLMQLARATESPDLIRKTPTQVRVFCFMFVILTVVFAPLLLSFSPLFAMELAAGITLGLMHPVNALCLLIHLLFTRPWEIVTTNPLLAALPRLLAAVCIFSWFLYPHKTKKPTPTMSRALLLILGFGAWSFLSTFVTADIAGAQFDWINTYFKSLIVFVMCLFFIDDRRSLSEFNLTIIITIVSLAGLGIFNYFTSSPLERAMHRLQAIPSFLDPNDTAAVTVLALPLALGLPFSRPAGLMKWLAKMVFLIISLAAIWYSQSRGAFLALFTQIVGVRTIHQFRRRWFSVAVLAVLTGLVYQGTLKFVQRDTTDLSASADSRVVFWKAAANMTIHHPIWGVGFDQYPDNYEAYSPFPKFEFGKRTAHSSWLLALAETGIPGGALFIAFFVVVWKIAWRRRRERPDQFYSILGYGVAMSFLSHTYALSLYLLCALILISDAIQERSDHAG